MGSLEFREKPMTAQDPLPKEMLMHADSVLNTFSTALIMGTPASSHEVSCQVDLRLPFERL